MYQDKVVLGDCTLYLGDCLDVMKDMPDESVNCCVTSPPYYGLRDYGVENQIGLEQTPDEYVSNLVSVFREVKRVLRDDGTLWLNLGDSYAGNCSQASNNGRAGFGNPREKIVSRVSDGLKPKDLIGIPWRAAFALQADGWYLRSDIIWHKPNPMPESVKDRPTKSHEHIFLLAKSEKYYYDFEAIKERTKTKDNSLRDRDKTRLNNIPGRTRMGGLKTNNYETRNKRDVWSINTKPFNGAHFAVFPPKLITPCILAGCPKGGFVLDPFNGSGTTGLVCIYNNRKYIGIDLNPEYIKMSSDRLTEAQQQMRLPI